jgi:uncharacterized protein (TIGR03083 family)
MALPRNEVEPGLIAELEAFETLIRPMTAPEWDTPTRCDGWTVGDVAAHVIGSMADVVALRLDGLGTPEVTAREVEERRGRTPAELADELAGVTKATKDLAAAFDDDSWNGPSPGGFDFTLADGIEALWYDTYLHGDDVRAALGRPSVEGPGVRASISHIATSLAGHGYDDVTLALDGQDEFAVGQGGHRIEGDAIEFVKAATGRGDPAAFGADGRLNIYSY